jgi:hypothetical protein
MAREAAVFVFGRYAVSTMLRSIMSVKRIPWIRTLASALKWPKE